MPGGVDVESFKSQSQICILVCPLSLAEILHKGKTCFPSPKVWRGLKGMYIDLLFPLKVGDTGCSPLGAMLQLGLLLLLQKKTAAPQPNRISLFLQDMQFALKGQVTENL